MEKFRKPRSWLIGSYGLWSVFILAIYAYISLTGWEAPNSEREVLPATVRSSPGGYRSFHFWHSGYHGGK